MLPRDGVDWVFPELLVVRVRRRERESEMGEEERELIRAASEEVSRQFKTLINGEEVESVKELQHLMSSFFGFFDPLHNCFSLIFENDLCAI